MKLTQFVGLYHPNSTGIYIVKKDKVKPFLEKNQFVWDKYNLDVDLFKEEPIYLKSEDMIDSFRGVYPEMFL